MQEKRQTVAPNKNTLSWDQIQLADMKHTFSDPITEKFHPYLQPVKKSPFPSLVFNNKELPQLSKTKSTTTLPTFPTLPLSCIAFETNKHLVKDSKQTSSHRVLPSCNPQDEIDSHTQQSQAQKHEPILSVKSDSESSTHKDDKKKLGKDLNKGRTPVKVRSIDFP